MQLTDLFLVLINVLVTSGGGLLLKVASGQKLWRNRILFTAGGMGIYFMMSFITLFLYSRYNLVLVQTLLSFTYVMIPVFAFLFLKEQLNRKIFLGLLLIIIGVFFVNLGNTIS
jgi:drug/metabolite transporter (DMT)-like permease